MKTLALVGLVFLLVMPSDAQAQLWPEWGDRLSGAEALNDVAVQAAVAGDTVFVVGYEEFMDESIVRKKTVIRRYDPSGAVTAQNQFPAGGMDSIIFARPRCIAVLPQNRVAIGGEMKLEGQQSFYDGFLAIFEAADLSFIGLARILGTRPAYASLHFLAYDSVYACLRGTGILTDTSTQFIDAFVMAWDIDGQPLWPHYSWYDYLHSTDTPYGLAVDATGNTYVTSADNSGTVISTFSVDASGNQRWVQTYTGSSYTLGTSLSRSPSGNIHVIGCSSGQALDLVYTVGGSFVRAFVHPDTSFFMASVFDAQGNHYCAGSVGGRILPLDTTTQVLVCKINPDGGQQWERRWADDSTYGHQGFAVVQDLYGRPVICDIKFRRSFGPRRVNFLALNPTDGSLVGYHQSLNVADSTSNIQPRFARDSAGDITFVGTKYFFGQNLDWVVIQLKPYMSADANGVGGVNGVDVVFLVNYLKGSDLIPSPFLSADANGNCEVNGIDVVYLVNYLKGYGEGPRYGDCLDLDEWFEDQ